MATSIRSPTVRLCLLRASGELVDRYGAEGHPASAHYLVLSRALCRHAVFAPPAPLRPAELERAARLYAEMHSPFAQADSLLTRCADGVAIWWWDSVEVRALLGGRWRYINDRIVPEALAAPAGDGWRQVETADGFDAQYWRDGELLVTLWRREPFDHEAWSRLRFAIDDESVPPPGAVPAPVVLPLPAEVGSLPRLKRGWDWPDLSRAAMAATVVAALAGGWLEGRAVRYDRVAGAERAATATNAAARPTLDTRRMRDRLARLESFNRLSVANPVETAGEVFATLEPFDVNLVAWRFDATHAMLELRQAPSMNALGDLVTQLEGSPILSQVSARATPDEGAVVEASIGPPAAVPSPPPSGALPMREARL